MQSGKVIKIRQRKNLGLWVLFHPTFRNISIIFVMILSH